MSAPPVLQEGSPIEAATPARLLIVDDEATQLRALCETLELEGYAVHGYSSPREALLALHPGAFDLLLTDLKMPGMDGIALIQAAHLADPTLDAVVMTGHGTIDTAVQAMQAGALDYILKPFNLKIIRPVLSRALRLQQLRRENRALQERERAQAAELAEAYRDLEAFSYSVSHDLRAPLRTIDGFTQILQEEYTAALDSEGQRLAGVIREGASRMDALIVGLLAFARAGRQPLERRSVDMDELARSAAAEMLAAHTGPSPRIRIDPLPRCHGDATALRQVWCNLIGNALKYSARRAEPSIGIRAVTDGHELVYQVEDNGAGFDMRQADKLFGVFQRLHSADEFTGTGVGLAIVARTLARHGGRIWAQAQPEQGATFFLALPRPKDLEARATPT